MAKFAMRKCIVCGVEYYPKAPNQLTCSEECSIKNRNMLHREWFYQHREEYNEKRRIRKAKKKQASRHFVVDFSSYDEYSKRQQAETIEKYARIKL